MPLAIPSIMTTVVTIIGTVITLAVFYLVLLSIKGKKFNTKAAISIIFINIIVLLLFEINRTRPVISLPAITILGALHGLFGVASIAAFVILIKLAHNYSKTEMNYLQAHKRLSCFVLFLWIISFVTGETVYFMLYVI